MFGHVLQVRVGLRVDRKRNVHIYCIEKLIFDRIRFQKIIHLWLSNSCRILNAVDFFPWSCLKVLRVWSIWSYLFHNVKWIMFKILVYPKMISFMLLCLKLIFISISIQYPQRRLITLNQNGPKFNSQNANNNCNYIYI